MSYGLNLALQSSHCRAGGLPPANVEQPPLDEGIPDVEEPTPIEDDPDWEIPPDPTPDPDPLPPPLVVNPGREVAQDRLEENGVAYRNPHAGPKDKKVKATLKEVGQTQGLIAALVKDQDNYIGTTFDVADGKLKIRQKIATVESLVGEVVAAVVADDVIGSLVKDDTIYITRNDEALAGPFTIPPALLEKPAGLVAKGPATAAWISSFSVEPVKKGYGQGYGLSYGTGL